MSIHVSKGPRFPITYDDIARVERRIEELRAETMATQDQDRRSQLEYFSFALEAMLPVYKSFVRLMERLAE